MKKPKYAIPLLRKLRKMLNDSEYDLVNSTFLLAEAAVLFLASEDAKRVAFNNLAEAVEEYPNTELVVKGYWKPLSLKEYMEDVRRPPFFNKEGK